MESTNYALGGDLVAFLDVLGQREKFRELRLPKTPEEHAKVKEVLRQTARFVVDLRAVFQKNFEAFEKGVSEIPIEAKESLRPNFVGFSDLFVTSAPLWSGSDHLVRVVRVFSVLSAAGVVMLTSLTSKHPLRGGIDVGLATEIAPNEIYGTALERAYLLECNVAQYPRIVIGDGLWDYLNAAIREFKAQATPIAKAITAITEKAMQMTAADRDGKRILDYLGGVMVENAGPGKTKTATNMVRPCYEFVLTEQERALREGDTKLAGRYALLRQYFESRLTLWGLDKH
jgi:hypothetical protein